MPVNFSIPKTTQTAGTVITAMIPGRRMHKTKITNLQITSGSTAHTWYFMREKARTTVVSAVAGSGTSIVITRDPGKYATNPEWVNRGITPSTADNAIAANDYLIVELADGTMQLLKPSAVSTDSSTGNVTLTVSAIGAAGINAGATIWFYGVVTDTDPHFNVADPSVAPGTSATTSYPASAGALGAMVTASFLPYSPILIYNANATAASTLDSGTVIYGD